MNKNKKAISKVQNVPDLPNIQNVPINTNKNPTEKTEIINFSSIQQKSNCGCSLKNSLSYLPTNYGTRLKDIINTREKK